MDILNIARLKKNNIIKKQYHYKTHIKMMWLNDEDWATLRTAATDNKVVQCFVELLQLNMDSGSNSNLAFTINNLCAQAEEHADPEHKDLKDIQEMIDSMGYIRIPKFFESATCTIAQHMFERTLQLLIESNEEKKGEEEQKDPRPVLEKPWFYFHEKLKTLFPSSPRLGSGFCLRRAGAGWWPHRVFLSMHPLFLSIQARLNRVRPSDLITLPTETWVGGATDLHRNGLHEMTKRYLAENNELQRTFHPNEPDKPYIIHSFSVPFISSIPEYSPTLVLVPSSHKYTRPQQHGLGAYLKEELEHKISKSHMWGEQRTQTQTTPTDQSGSAEESGLVYVQDDLANDLAAAFGGETKTETVSETKTETGDLFHEMNIRFKRKRLNLNVGDLVLVHVSTYYAFDPPSVARPLRVRSKSLLNEKQSSIEQIEKKISVEKSMLDKVIGTKSPVRMPIRALRFRAEQSWRDQYSKWFASTILVCMDTCPRNTLTSKDIDILRTSFYESRTIPPMAGNGLSTLYPRLHIFGKSSTLGRIEHIHRTFEDRLGEFIRVETSDSVKAMHQQ